MPRALASLRAFPSPAKTGGAAGHPQGKCGVSMGQSSMASGQLSADMHERLLGFLRREHPADTVKCTARALACAPDTVRKWFDRSSKPSFALTMRAAAVYGPRLLAATLGPGFAWLDAAAAEESRKQFSGRVELLRREFGLD